MIVCKFGGTSCCSGSQLKKVKDILLANPERRYVIVSAPGKRFDGDQKVTDLLYQLDKDRHTASILAKIQQRYADIIRDAGITFDLDHEFEVIQNQLDTGSTAWLVSRGEYLNAKIFAAYMNWPFLEAADMIFFDENHHLIEPLTYRFMKKEMLAHANGVIPGFYGSDEAGNIAVFPRGGSDVSGALAARAVQADAYENWTDVDGILTADPHLVPEAKPINTISYQELRELSYMGAGMLQEEAVFPCRNAGIPINLRNTNHPNVQGTWIVSETKQRTEAHQPITGIAGKKGFSNIQIEKAMMNTQIGFGAKALSILAEHGVSFEHNPTSIDTMSILVPTADLKDCRKALLADLQAQLSPDNLFIEDGIALIAVVGEGIIRHVGFAARLFGLVAEAGINVRMIDVGFSEMNVIIGVNEEDFEKTIRVIHQGLVAK
ncbi:aspartate kinase [Stecheria sp. CLA-KB-P133]|uniref:Aspartokinase n=1 Tax=Grylomicrobium aquisgranensis TaxID=2926318 RepID=A0AB35U7S1_9FIRM|nr:aspartate kinase [Stecheria sp. CLA-KB-P133]